MAADPKLVVALEARLNKFEKDLKSAGLIADRQVKAIEDRFAKANLSFGAGALDSLTRNFLAAAAGGLALDQAIKSIRTSIGQVDDLGDMSERLGISTDAIQALRHTLGQAGGDAELADKAFDKFADTMAEAALGGGYLAKVFAANGVALKDSAGQLKTTEALLVDFARLVTNAGSAQEKLKLATDGFGRQAGPKMVGMLEQIANQGMTALIAKAKELGVVLDNDVIEKAGELDKAFRKVEERVSTAFKKMSVEWGGPLLLDALKGVEIAFKNIALSVELISLGRVREALGIITRFEAAKQKIGMGAAGQITPEEASSFYDTVPTGAPKQTKLTVTPAKKTILPSVKEDKKESKDSFERALDTIEKRRALLEAETKSIDLNAAARERARVVAELETAARKANTDAGLANTEVTAEQALKINAVADAYLKVAEASEKANSPMARFAREASDVNKHLQEAAVGGLQGFEDAISGIISGSVTAADAFKRMADAIIADLIRIAIRAAITGPLVRALGGGFGGSPVDVGSATSIGTNAAGTDNWRGGPTWVGERGPEIVNLPRGAQVIPNHVARGMGSGGITNNISVVNNAGADVQQRTSRNASGGQDLALVIDPIVARNVSTPGSASDRALRGRGQVVRR